MEPRVLRNRVDLAFVGAGGSSSVPTGQRSVFASSLRGVLIPPVTGAAG